MKHVLFVFAFCSFLVFNTSAQTTASVKKATPVVKIDDKNAKAAKDDDKNAKAACCKGKAAKDCCKGKGDAKACAGKTEGLQTAEGNKVENAAAKTPPCCAGKKAGASCASAKKEEVAK